LGFLVLSPRSSRFEAGTSAPCALDAGRRTKTGAEMDWFFHACLFFSRALGLTLRGAAAAFKELRVTLGAAQTRPRDLVPWESPFAAALGARKYVPYRRQRPSRPGKVVRFILSSARNERQNRSRHHGGVRFGRAERGSNCFRLSRRGSNWMQTQFAQESLTMRSMGREKTLA